MKFASIIASLVTAGLCSVSAATICPSTSSTNTDCGYILNINIDGSITGAAVAGANPYDGSDDALVGVVNLSPTVFSGAITLSGTGNGGGIFAFDGDGICVYNSTNSISLAYCSASQKGGVSPGDYQGPLNTFTNINASGTMGTVVITGLAPGASTFFSLEGSPATIGGGIVITPNVPEPATMALLGGGFAGLYLIRRRRLN